MNGAKQLRRGLCNMYVLFRDRRPSFFYAGTVDYVVLVLSRKRFERAAH